MSAKKKEPGLEQTIEELEQVMEALNQPEVSLEESFALYKKGMDLLLACNRSIDKVEKELMILEENGIGEEL